MSVGRLVLGLLVLLAVHTTVSAAVITGYDVTDTPLSGFGGWQHTYTGSITNTGTLSGTASVKADYSGGTGTMADGLVGSSTNQSHLFWVADLPSITVYLDNTYNLTDIALLNFPSGNSIPGNITGVDVTIGSTTQSFVTSVLNTRDEFIELSGTPLASLAASSFTLSNFTIDAEQYANYFSISEIQVNGTPVSSSSVPVPAPLALFGIGVLALGVSRRRG